MLCYQNEILNDDNKTIDEYKICDQSLINIVQQFNIVFNIKNKKRYFKNVQISDKIIDIKYKIQEKIGLHTDEQQLVYQDEILEDDKMICQYGIISEYSTIDVLIKEGIKLFVKTIDKDFVEFTVPKTQKIGDIRKAIQYKKGIKVEKQILIYQDKILEMDKTFDEYGISNKSIICAAKFRKKMQIIAVKIKGLTVVFYAEKVKNIIDLKKEIEKKIGINLGKYDLQYKDIILDENNKDLTNYEINVDFVLFIVAKPRMKIYVKTLLGRTILIKLKQYSKIREIKYHIQDQIGMHPDEQKLVYQDKLLDDDKTIIDYEICENSTIQLLDNLSEIQIVVTKSDGKTIALQMQKIEKIIDLKYKIQKKTGLHPDEQKLTYQGELLKDEITFDEYNMNDKAMINNVIHMRGGMKVTIKIQDVFAFYINIQNNETIGEIKRKIGSEIDFPADELKLICQCTILDDNKTLEDYPLINGSEMIIDVLFRDEINIIFTTMDKSKFRLKYLKLSDKISDLKLRIQEKMKIHREMQKLIYNENVLLDDDDKSIDDYQILDNSVIHVEIENKLYKCNINEYDNMKHIRTNIENQKQLDSQHQALVFNKKLLRDGKLLIYFEIKSRQDMKMKTDFKNFINAIKLNQYDEVRIHFVNDHLLVKYGSNVNYPIHCACEHACKEIIDFLIKNGCELEVTDWENKTPIHVACIYGNIDAVESLIRNKCNINAIDYLQRRPIHLACENKHKDIVELLLRNKCEIEINDYFDRCPSKIAKDLRLKDIINIINIRKVIDAMKLNLDEWFTSMVSKQFKGDLIYEGVYDGKVYHFEAFAYKKFDKERISSKYIEGNINDFMEILRNVRIIKYFGGFEIKQKKYVFMEFIETGSLRNLIGKRELPLMKFIKQLLEALVFVHGKQIIHRDIKPENILIDSKKNIKLTDFGLSWPFSNIKEEISLEERFCGTQHYMAPEILNDEIYSCSVDIWSLGVTIIEMATGVIPYKSLKQDEFIIKILTTRKIEYELPRHSEKLKTFIDEMLNSNGSNRADAQRLLHIFYTNFPNHIHDKS